MNSLQRLLSSSGWKHTTNGYLPLTANCEEKNKPNNSRICHLYLGLKTKSSRTSVIPDKIHEGPRVIRSGDGGGNTMLTMYMLNTGTGLGQLLGENR